MDVKLSALDLCTSTPQVRLGNYLLNLVDDSDGKETSVYVLGAEKFVRGVWGDMIKQNYRTLQVRKFVPSKLGVHPIMLYGYKNRKKAISVQLLHRLLGLWGEVCRKDPQEVHKKWDEIYSSGLDFSRVKGVVPLNYRGVLIRR